MMSFQKPENALKRSEELIEVSKPEDALDVLRQALITRRFRFQWSDAMEEIMKSYIRLSGSLKRMRSVKDGLLQYRSACQSANMGSFDTVVRFFCSYSEEIVAEAKSRLPKQDSILDLDENESPQSLLLTAFGADGTSEDERQARQSLKNLWDTYRTALEVTRSHVAVESLYHEIAVKACNFCLTYGRKNEFRRLCDLLRTYHQYLPKSASQFNSGPQVVSAGAPETISRTLETRGIQMKAAIELGLWTTAYQVADDMQALMQRRRPSPQQLRQYYQSLSKIFLVSSSAQHKYLFHASTALKGYLLGKQINEVQDGEVDSVVLAVLASFADSLLPQIPVLDNMAIPDQTEKVERMSLLTSSAGAAPVPEQLMSELTQKGVIQAASPIVKKIFSMIAGDNIANFHTADISALLAQLPSELQGYASPISRVVLVRTLTDMCSLFTAMSFKDFSDKTGITSFTEIDRILSHLRRGNVADIKLDYLNETVRLKKPVSEFIGCKSARVPITTDATQIADLSKKFFAQFEEAVDREREQLQARKLFIIKKQQDLERKTKEAEEDRLRRAKEADETARDAAAKKAEEDVKRREIEARERAKIARQLEEAKALEERIKDDKLKAKITTENKPIAVMVKELEKTLDAQIKKEKALKLQQRKSEFRRVNLTAKVLRVEEAKAVTKDYKPNVAQVDLEIVEALKVGMTGDIAAAKAARAEAKAALQPVLSTLEEWKEKQVAARKVSLATKIAAAKEQYLTKTVRHAIEEAFDIINEEEDQEAAYKQYEAAVTKGSQ